MTTWNSVFPSTQSRQLPTFPRHLTITDARYREVQSKLSTVPMVHHRMQGNQENHHQRGNRLTVPHQRPTDRFCKSHGPGDDGSSFQGIWGEWRDRPGRKCFRDDGDIQPSRTPRPHHWAAGEGSIICKCWGTNHLWRNDGLQRKHSPGTSRDFQWRHSGMETKTIRSHALGKIKGVLPPRTPRATARGDNVRKIRIHGGSQKYLQRASACLTRRTQYGNLVPICHITRNSRSESIDWRNRASKPIPHIHKHVGNGATLTTHSRYGWYSRTNKETVHK